MSLLPILSIAITIISMYIGFYSIKLDYRSKLNRVFLLLILSLIIWNLSYLFIYDANSKEACILWHKISAIGWCFSFPLMLHFSLILSKNENLLRKPFIYFFIYFPAFVFLIKNSFVDFSALDFIYKNNIWIAIVSNESVWYKLFLIYSILLTIFTVSVIWIWGFTSKRESLRNQARIIIFSILISVIGGILFNSFSTIYNEFPTSSHYFAFVLILGIWYTILKYKLMVLTPEIAVDEIISKITDLLVLVNPSGRITLVNKQVETLLGFSGNKLIGKNFSEITFHADEINNEFFRISTGIPHSDSLEIDYKTESGNKIPVKASISVMRNLQNEFIGVVIVAQDMRQTIFLQDDIKERIKMEQFQSIIYSISKAASTSENLNQLYEKIYFIIQQNINTKNFYIALCDDVLKTVSFPFFVDENDEKPEPREFKNGLTERVFNSGKPALITTSDFEKLIDNKEVEIIGTLCKEWLGVPLITQNKKFGVIVVQNYNQALTITDQQKDLLIFVSEQVAMSIDLKRVEESLKKNAELLLKAEQLAKICSWELDINLNKFTFSDSFWNLIDFDGNRLYFTHDDLVQLIYFEDKEIYLQKIIQVLNAQNNEFEIDFRIIDKNNNFKYYKSIGILQKNIKNEPIKVVASIQDVTELKKNE